MGPIKIIDMNKVELMAHCAWDKGENNEDRFLG